MGRYNFKLPDVGEGIAEAEVVAWHVKPGDTIAEDQPLVDVMTDKATVEITSPVSGRVLALNAETGAQAAIGSVIVVLDVDGAADEAAPDAKPAAKAAAPVPKAAAPAPLAAKAQTAAPVVPKPPSGERATASPAVRRRAFELGVPLQFVGGSGPGGRITHEDLEGYAAPPHGAASGSGGLVAREGVETIKVAGLRRRISEKMSEAKRRIPHFSYIEEIDVTELERLRAQINAAYPDRQKLTVLPFMVHALARALVRFPQINATYDDEAGEVHRHAALHLGVATQTPGGLVVPVLRHAEALSLWAAASEIARLADAARTGKATREELSGSTLTITSLGPLGGVAHTPVINRPEVAIVGPNRIIERPVVVGGQIVVRKMMNLSCSFDHRVIDGWDAAEFVAFLKRDMENPALMFVE